jgi:hypothetical protein
MNPSSFERLYSEREYIISDDNPRTPYTPKETIMTKDTTHRIIETPKESSRTVVVITWESGMVNVYRKDSKELLDTLIHEHEMIYEVQEAEMIS